MTGPRRNRCDPFGDLHAVPDKGALMGNRGCLHDDTGTIVRSYRGKAWIICDPRAPGPKRPHAAPGQYTPLFFLDEATALAAGHRPCGQCRRAAAADFKARWQAARLGDSTAVAIDTRLFAERKGRVPLSDGVPGGVMAGKDDRAWLRWQGGWRAWSFAGYEPGVPPADAAIVTPPSIVAVLAAGYQPIVHPSATGVDAAPAAP